MRRFHQRAFSRLRRYLGLNATESAEAAAYRRLREQLADVPRFQVGRVSVDGWQIEYVDAASMLTAYDSLIVKRWNDFRCEKETPYILDCGANIGLSVLHFKRKFPKSRIVAFEPDNRICHFLRTNLSTNHIEDVTVVEAAVWVDNGIQLFAADAADAGRLAATYPVQTDQYIEVATRRLADCLSGEQVDFLKLDIEGAEAEVIADCRAEIANVQQMAIEFHYWASRPQELIRSLEIIAQAGFEFSVNSYFRLDLVNHSLVAGNTSRSFDQVLLICAWKAPSTPSANDSILHRAGNH